MRILENSAQPDTCIADWCSKDGHILSTASQRAEQQHSVTTLTASEQSVRQPCKQVPTDDSKPALVHFESVNSERSLAVWPTSAWVLTA